MSAESRFLIGTAYANLVYDEHMAEHPFSFIVAQAIDKVQHGFGLTPQERKCVYHDMAVVLNASTDNINMNGLPIHVHHDTNAAPVGKIHQTIVNGATIKILAEVWDPEAVRQMDSGDLRSLSIGYGFTTQDNGWHIRGKKIREVSLVKEPFFDGCHVHVTASKESPGENSNNKKSLLYNDLLALDLSSSLTAKLLHQSTMATPGTGTPATPAPQDPLPSGTHETYTADEMQQVLVVTKTLTKQLEEMKKEREQLLKVQEENKRLTKEREERIKKEMEVKRENLHQLLMTANGVQTLVRAEEGEGMEDVPEEARGIYDKDELEALEQEECKPEDTPLSRAIRKTLQRTIDRFQPKEEEGQAPRAQPAKMPTAGHLGDVYSTPSQSPRVQKLLHSASSVPSARASDPYPSQRGQTPGKPAIKKNVAFAPAAPREVAVNASRHSHGNDPFAEAVAQAQLVLQQSLQQGRISPGTTRFPETMLKRESQ